MATFSISAAGCGAGGKLVDILDPPGDTLAPVAVIDTSGAISVKSYARLDGSGSNDPKEESLTYSWTLAERPYGSNASITSGSTSTTNFFADKGGYYTVTLKVMNTSGKSSEVTSATINAVGTDGNHPPVANVSSTVFTGMAVLDATSSYDADGDPLTYRWSLLNAPTGSTSTLTPDNASVARLTANTSYSFGVSLVVSDGVDSDETFTTVTISQ